MKKSISVILIVLLAFTVWPTMAFGKEKKEQKVEPKFFKMAQSPVASEGTISRCRSEDFMKPVNAINDEPCTKCPPESGFPNADGDNDGRVDDWETSFYNDKRGNLYICYCLDRRDNDPPGWYFYASRFVPWGGTRGWIGKCNFDGGYNIDKFSFSRVTHNFTRILWSNYSVDNSMDYEYEYDVSDGTLSVYETAHSGDGNCSKHPSTVIYMNRIYYGVPPSDILELEPTSEILGRGITPAEETTMYYYHEVGETYDYVEGSQAYEEDNNFGGIADAEWEVNFNGDGATYVNGGYYGSYLLGTEQADLNCSYGDLYPVHSFEPLAAPAWDTFTISGAAGDYWIEQATFKFKHNVYDIYITEYVFGFWVPEGGTKDCELAIEHVFVLENQGVDAVIGLQSGILNDIDIGDNACEVDFDAVHNSMWMYELVNDTLVFGMTKKPAIVGDYAVTGWGLLNGARIYDGQYTDSLFLWMQSGTWQVDDYGTGDDKAILLADVPFDLQPGQVRIEKWLKWGYPGAIAPGGDADWRHFLYNILHQEGFYRGDANKDGFFNVNDVIWMVNYLFKGGALPIEFKSQMDVNCDGNTTISDVVYTINYLFKGGAAPIDKNRFFLESPYVDSAHKAAYINRAPGLFGDPDWKDLGK